MKVHHLKTIPPFFEDVRLGRKTFELRKNDRDFHINDILHLEEYDPEKGYTKRIHVVFVVYILQNFPGIEEGYCILGIHNFPTDRNF